MQTMFFCVAQMVVVALCCLATMRTWERRCEGKQSLIFGFCHRVASRGFLFVVLAVLAHVPGHVRFHLRRLTPCPTSFALLPTRLLFSVCLSAFIRAPIDFAYSVLAALAATLETARSVSANRKVMGWFRQSALRTVFLYNGLSHDRAFLSRSFCDEGHSEPPSSVRPVFVIGG